MTQKTLQQRVGELINTVEEVKLEYAEPNSTIDIGNLYYLICNLSDIVKEQQHLLKKCKDCIEHYLWFSRTELDRLPAKQTLAGLEKAEGE